MKKLLLACAATLGLCASGSLAHAGGDYVTGDDYQRPAPRHEYREERVERVVPTRHYVPLLPPLPFLPVPCIAVDGPAVAVRPRPVVVEGPGPVIYGRPYPHRRWHRRYAYRRGYYGGPGVHVGIGF